MCYFYPDMANLRVVLVRYCKTEQGWRRYPVLTGKNGRVKPNCVLVSGEERCYPEGSYQLRSYEGRRMVYQDVGENAADALAARDRALHLMSAKHSASAAGTTVHEAPGRVYLRRALERHIQAAEDRGSKESALVHRLAGEDFLHITGKTFADELSVDDILLHQRELRKRGCSDRNIYNRHVSVVALLKACGLDVKALAPRRPRFEKKLPEIYSPEQLRTLFNSLGSQPQYALTFALMLQCGLRDQEAVYLEWSKVQLSTGVLQVRSNPKYGFKIKDYEERDVPMPPDLVERAQQYRGTHLKDVLVNGKPNQHLLRVLKRLAREAGLNCGVCAPCKDRGACEDWFLHKFRATCLTTWLRSGMDVRTVMEFAGHSDINSTMRYLPPATHASVREKISSIKWM